MHTKRLNQKAQDDIEVTEAELKTFIKKYFNQEKIPGTLTVPAEVFKNELKKYPITSNNEGSIKLRDKIKESQKGVRLLKAGKGLMETFEESTGISLPRTS
jgi:hypothetical protein